MFYFHILDHLDPNLSQPSCQVQQLPKKIQIKCSLPENKYEILCYEPT